MEDKRTRKKNSNKRIIAGILAVVVGGITVAANYTHVQASSAMMPGIETIVENNQPFKILELVNDKADAEIGYMVSGQEPYLKNFTYTEEGQTKSATTLSEALSAIPNKTEREAFANYEEAREYSYTGTGDEDDYPMSYSPYEEKYFLSEDESEEDWQLLSLKEKQTDMIRGYYQENRAGKGDYTKQEQSYYPIRKDSDGNQLEADIVGKEKYRENIQSFYFAGNTLAEAPYVLGFKSIANEEIQSLLTDDSRNGELDQVYDYADVTGLHYGYYENVYEELTTDMASEIEKKEYKFPGENEADDRQNKGDTQQDLKEIEEIEESLNMGGKRVVTEGRNEACDGTTGEVLNTQIRNQRTAGTRQNPYVYLAYLINEYPYYRYVAVGDLAYINSQAEDAETAERAGQITRSGDQYWYWVLNENRLEQTPLFVVTGREQVEKSAVQVLPESIDYPYYYQVTSMQFAAGLSQDGKAENPHDYKYSGWYYSSIPENAQQYLAVEDDDPMAAYYISTEEYVLTPEVGNYDFISDAEGEENLVEVDHIFYKGGYTNHDWLKKYVFHLSPEDEDAIVRQQFQNFVITVDTVEISPEKSDTIDNYNEYDLIYVNGQLSDASRAKLLGYLNGTDGSKPCIFNQSRLSTGERNTLKTLLSAYIEEKDTNDFVSKQLYFFGGDSVQKLAASDFKKNISGDQLEGFSDISDYIKLENDYRKTIESGEGEHTEPLKEDISAARAIEYIVNYQYKRVEQEKRKIRVLDIEPANPAGSLTENMVTEWLGYSVDRIVEVTSSNPVVCCSGTNDIASHIVDGKTNTIWHSDWDKRQDAKTNHRKNGPHYFEVSVDTDGLNISELVYTPRQGGTGNGDQNGRAKKLKVTFYDKNGSSLGSVETEGEWANSATPKSIKVDPDSSLYKKSGKTTKIRVEFLGSYSTDNYKYASCAEFRVRCTKTNGHQSAEPPEITIDSMTTLEYVGRLDDINAQYDLIYFGADTTNRKNMMNGAGNQSLYAHIGAASDHRSGNIKMMGLLDTEYFTKYSVLLDPTNSGNGEVGVFRGSGNDITEQQVEELRSFISSGFPVVIAEGLLKEEDGRKVVDPSVVDKSSYIYEFLNEAITQNGESGNVLAEDEAADSVKFFLNISKPEIVFTQVPPEPQRLDSDSYLYNEKLNTTAHPSVVAQGDLTGEGLVYQFSLRNESEISSATATYDCELFLDLNFDGNLSETNENQSNYIEIKDAQGQVVTRNSENKYELRLNTPYTMTRKIPMDYYKIITWKLQIRNNQNSEIRVSEMGFTKRKAQEDSKQTIKVLQIRPGSSVTWNLEADNKSDDNGSLKNLLKDVSDFKIEIKSITASEYVQEYKKNNSYLDQFQMLIMGFADGYGQDKSLDNEPEATNAIGEFVKQGKSAIFSHDTSSYINAKFSNGVSEVPRSASGSANQNQRLSGWNWGYALNTYLRPYLGMDRYGVTLNDQLEGKDYTVSSVLKKGQGLSRVGSADFEAIEDAASDMAYAYAGENDTPRSETYSQVHGYTSYLADGKDLGTSITTQATKVNEGAITQYPYRISASDTIQTAKTHGQYYQLAMEEDADEDGKNDIVVWYCLEDGQKNYEKKDVRNGYYYYSKGNVIYTGIGHASDITQEEKKLFVNSIIAAAQVVATKPEATMLEKFDPAANTEQVRYFSKDRSDTNSDNLLEENMDFQVKIRDYNMAAAIQGMSVGGSNVDQNQQTLTMEVYIEDESGDYVYVEENGKTKQLTDINKKVKRLSGDNVKELRLYSDKGANPIAVDEAAGAFTLSGNDTVQFTVNDIEQYVREGGNQYKSTCTLYVKVTSTIMLYGKPVTSHSVAELEIKPRQLFDLN